MGDPHETLMSQNLYYLYTVSIEKKQINQNVAIKN